MCIFYLLSFIAHYDYSQNDKICITVRIKNVIEIRSWSWSRSDPVSDAFICFSLLKTYAVLGLLALNTQYATIMTFKNLLLFFTCQNKHHKASVIVFTTSLEAALIQCNDSGPFSATPEMDADRKNVRCGLLPITESTKLIYRPTSNYERLRSKVTLIKYPMFTKWFKHSLE